MRQSRVPGERPLGLWVDIARGGFLLTVPKVRRGTHGGVTHFSDDNIAPPKEILCRVYQVGYISPIPGVAPAAKFLSRIREIALSTGKKPSDRA